MTKQLSLEIKGVVMKVDSWMGMKKFRRLKYDIFHWDVNVIKGKGKNMGVYKTAPLKYRR